MENTQYKNPLLAWAENEVKLACQHENSDWDGKSFDYGCACYTSALEVFKVLCGQGHSGFSWRQTIRILERLGHNLPLTPITLEDFGYIPGVTPELTDTKTGATMLIARVPTEPDWCDENGDKHFQCPRESGLFLTIHPDNTYELTDIDRFVCVDIECIDNTYTSGLERRIAEQMFSIDFPYYPGKNKYYIYTRTFLTDKKNGDFDTKEICYIKTPDGKEIPINRYFHEINGKFEEVSKEQYDELCRQRIDTWERRVVGHIANDIVEDIFNEGEKNWEVIIGDDKWRPNYDDEYYEEKKDYYQSYNYREIWWALHRKVVKCNSCDPILDNLEKAVLAATELREQKLSRWDVYRRISKLDNKLLDKYPSLHGVYDTTEQLINWVKTRYSYAMELTNRYIKELDDIEDNNARYARREMICKQIIEVNDIINL